METFYKTLSSSRTQKTNLNTTTPCSPFVNQYNAPKLNKDQQNICEGVITAKECLSALKTFARNKLPEIYLWF